MVKHELVAPGTYSYATLADPATRREANADLTGWLDRLRLPAVIDEAQLIEDLPLAIKERVDALGPGNWFVLTGSASIARTGLGGADPLTRRAVRLTLNPITAWENEQLDGSLVDALFDSVIVEGALSRKTDEELLSQMRLGGFPGYVYQTTPLTSGDFRRRVESDTISLLSDSILPGRGFDAAITREVLDAVLRAPGGIFTATSHARELEVDRRTVEKHISILHRLFLLHSLPNSAVRPSKQSYSRRKMHAVDTSLAVESLLRSGADLATNREMFGALLETHVVNQIRAAIEWSTASPDASYWREASHTNPEVDLVLTAGERRIGIEIKAASTVSARDAKGLEALRRAVGLHRGFVFYTGSELRQIGQDIWAMPLSTLESNAWTLSKANEPASVERIIVNPISPAANLNVDARLFVSYVHADDTRLRGRMVQFAHDVADTYALLYGREVELFVDRDDIEWGESWEARLDDELASVPFLMSMVTPRYLASEACRREVLEFAAASRRGQDSKRLLPVLWIDIADSDIVPASDPVRQQLLASQYLDMKSGRTAPVDSAAYDEVVERAAERLRRSVVQMRGAVKQASDDPSDTSREDGDLEMGDERDLSEVFEDFTAHGTDVEKAVADLQIGFATMGEVMSSNPMPRATTPSGAAAQFRQLGLLLAEPVRSIEVATQLLGNAWQQTDADVSRVTQIVEHFPDNDLVTTLRDSLSSLDRTLELPGIEVMAAQMTALGAVSRHLQPLARAMTGALTLLQGIKSSASAWADRL